MWSLVHVWLKLVTEIIETIWREYSFLINLTATEAVKLLESYGQIQVSTETF